MRDLDTLLNSLVNSDLNPSLQFSPQRLRPPRLVKSARRQTATQRAKRHEAIQRSAMPRNARARRHACQSACKSATERSAETAEASRPSVAAKAVRGKIVSAPGKKR